jgi:UDP-N-acetylmuramoyl-tripeptide--D-alanyl-D-alanine ligase
VGKDFFANAIKNDFLHFYPTFEDFAKHISTLKLERQIILIKGSRGMALERTLEYI